MGRVLRDEGIHPKYPDLPFILIGDSGQKNPGILELRSHLPTTPLTKAGSHPKRQ
ncbi:MAG: hypothetical protein ICV77_16815 [Cyanobacteria bacterium Co-bin8]|nr:hypothetical protein [Cyanobacteria bacterium Co-bin8]